MSTEIRYLSLRDLLRFRDQLLREGRSYFKLVDDNAARSALAAPRQAFFEHELYPSLAAKAGALVTLLIKNHPFQDGNKRIASLALQEFLRRNGHELSASDDELRAMLLALARGHYDRPDASSWIATRLTSQA